MAGPITTVWAQFRLDMSDFASKLNTASSSLRTFAKTQQNVLRQQNQGYDRANTVIKSFNRSLSDTVNITRGIIISQTFYAAVGAIRDATNALWDFNKQLDYAQVTYSALFGDVNLAKDFMAVLQEHSIETIFDYQDLAGMSKKLLAYGIDYKNLMFIMEGLTNLGAMSGDAAALDRIALALGQIYTKGKLSAEEMRQLANAYVPITEIITEKFGLSEEDLGRVGDLNLPAEQVINAIIDYANENFGSVGDAAMLTITGLQAKIVDTLKVVGSEMLKPVTTAYKSFLAYIASGLENIRAAFASGGIGGVFEYLVPDERVQNNIRIFLANIKNLFNAIMSLGKAAGQVFGNFAQVFVAVFNAVVPAITTVTNLLAAVIDAMASTRTGAALLRVALVAVAGAFILMRVQAIGALVITAVTKAVTTLSKALVVLATIISKHPILSLLAMLGVALLGISVSSNSANKSLSGFFDTLAGAGGSSSNDMLQKTEQDIINAEDALNQFNNRLGDAVDGADELEDGINDAGKAAKKTSGLLSFDEVFKLPDKDKDHDYSYTGPSVTDDLESIIDGLGSLGTALVPEIPDFSEYFNDYNNSLLGGLSDDLKEKISAGGWGALIGGAIGALIGSAFGNPVLGAKIGAAAGAFIGVLFDELEYAVNNTGTGVFAGIWGAVAGGLSKAGAAGLGTIIKNAFKSGGIKGVWTALAGVIKNTGVKAISKGGVAGFAIGLVVDTLAHFLWGALDEKFASANEDTAKVGQTIGGLLGTVIGTLLGGPAGALIGSAIGTFAGGFVGLFWDDILKKFDELGINLGTIIGTMLGAAIPIPGLNPTVGAVLGTISVDIAEWLSKNKDGFTTWWLETMDGFTTWWHDTKTGFSTWIEETSSGLSDWWSNTKLGFSGWWIETKNSLSSWWSDTVAIFSDWDSITGDTLGEWWSDTTQGFDEWFAKTKEKLFGWCDDTSSRFSSWVTNTASAFGNWVSTTTASFINWARNTAQVVIDWVKQTAKSISDWVKQTAKAISDWVKDTAQSIIDWVQRTLKAFTDWVNDGVAIIGGFAIATVKAIKQWGSNMLSNISTWLGKTGEKISTWFTDKATSITNSWNGLWDPKKWKAGWESVKKWFSDLWSSISGWFTDLGSKVSEWWNGLWDGKKANVNVTSGDTPSVTMAGHAAGGVFNREHIARFAEGNKAEAIIPLENNRAMQPFVDAVSNGIVNSLAPIVANINAGNSSGLPPMYVGTLIGDERGLRELYKRFEVIQVQENARRGSFKEAF